MRDYATCSLLVYLVEKGGKKKRDMEIFLENREIWLLVLNIACEGIPDYFSPLLLG